MKILVVIVTYNAMKWIDDCLGSVRQSKVPLETMIIDNGSTDETVSHIKKNYPEVNLIESKENLGFGRANNIGLQYVVDHNYDYAYLLNQDAWIFPETVGKLLDVFEKHPEFGVLSPMQLRKGCERIDVKFEHIISEHSVGFLRDLYFNKVAEVYELPGVMAAHWLITRDCIKKVGVFSPTFPHRGEDTNYINRLFYHGFKIGFVPHAISVHDRHVDNPRQRVLYNVYVTNLVTLSEIHNERKHKVMVVIGRSLLSCVKYCSFRPLFDMFKLFSAYKFIVGNRKQSLKEGAFLNLNP